MKRVENCEINEIVRPVMDGWSSDGGGGRMRQAEEYYVHSHFKDGWCNKGRLYAPYSFVKVRDGAGLDYCLNYGRFVISRLEPAPSLSELAAMPQEFWVSGNEVFYDTGLNWERFQQLIKQSEAAGIKVATARPSRPKSTDRVYVVNMANIGAASHLTKQAAVCLSLIIESGKTDGIVENDLAELLRQNGARLNTKQDPWKIFNFYKKALIEAGIISVEEGA